MIFGCKSKTVYEFDSVQQLNTAMNYISSILPVQWI